MTQPDRIHAVPSGESTFDCPCCGKLSRTIWGEVHDRAGSIVPYYCQWTVDRPDHDANIDLVIGAWGEGTTADDRAMVCLLFRRSEPAGFMVIDSEPRLEKVSGLAATGLARDEVIGTWIAKSAFLVVDVIWSDDPRIADLLAAR
jgi:hypothetical protein